MDLEVWAAETAIIVLRAVLRQDPEIPQGQREWAKCWKNPPKRVKAEKKTNFMNFLFDSDHGSFGLTLCLSFYCFQTNRCFMEDV